MPRDSYDIPYEIPTIFPGRDPEFAHKFAQKNRLLENCNSEIRVALLLKTRKGGYTCFLPKIDRAVEVH